MKTFRRYKIDGWFGVDIEEVRYFLEDRYGRELPDEYEPTDDEWYDAAWSLLMDNKISENIDDIIQEG